MKAALIFIRTNVPFFILGFFSVVAQSLLFRDFMTVFDYTELGASVFFGTWLLWVAIGAWVGKIKCSTSISTIPLFPLFVLAYIPAFSVQHFLFFFARELVGVQSFVVMPLSAMAGLLLFFNIPVSVLSGFLFVAACRWTESRMPAAKIYALEALGAAVGGGFTTLGLISGLSSHNLFMWAACITIGLLSLRFWIVHSATRKKCIAGSILIILLASAVGVCILHPLARFWTRWEEKVTWARLLPVEGFEGSVSTAYTAYLYGRYENQFVVMSGGSICESFPEQQQATEIMAVHMAQHPEAQRILLFGANMLSTGAVFSTLPNVASVDWMHPDPDYVTEVLPKLNIVLPEKLHPLFGDIRKNVREIKTRYDLIILALPDLTTLTVNRFCTVEFFGQLKNLLKENGVLSVRVAGGVNYLGDEIADPGASALVTLKPHFAHRVIKPGGETWIFASNSTGLSQDAHVLAKRFSQVKGGSALFAPEALLLLYPADRVHYQMEAYQQVLNKVDERALINSDNRPRALTYGLMLAVKKSEWRTLVRLVRRVVPLGAWLFLLPLLLYVLLRTLYWLNETQTGLYHRKISSIHYSYTFHRLYISPFDTRFLVFSAGLAGMAANILLLFVYQSRFGSLFREIGLLTALFMLGGSVGSAILRAVLISSKPLSTRIVVLTCVSVHVALLVLLSPLPELPRFVWYLVFFAFGLCTGMYFPVACAHLDESGKTRVETGSALQLSDHLGGAAGAFVTGLGLLPLAGTTLTLLLLASLMAISSASLLVFAGSRTLQYVHREKDFATGWGYVLFGITVFALAVSYLTARAQPEGISLEEAAYRFFPGVAFRRESMINTDGIPVCYLTLENQSDGQPVFIILPSDWRIHVSGYGGPIHLALAIDSKGTLLDYQWVSQNETVTYLALVESEKKRFIGRNILQPNAFTEVDAVSGATITSKALFNIFEEVGREFSRIIHKEPQKPSMDSKTIRFPWSTADARDFFLLLLLFLVTLYTHFYPGKWKRRFILLMAVGICGLWFNQLFSLQQIVMVADLKTPSPGLTTVFFVFVMPLFVAILMGNLYCGYLCPFGALQELAYEALGRLLPWKVNLTSNWRKVKYIVLFGLLLVFAGTRDYGIVRSDILVTVFAKTPDYLVLIVAGITLLLSVITPRLWCRVLCPTGAFLSLCGRVTLLRKWMPSCRPYFCHLGVTSLKDKECLYCDQCRVVGSREEEARNNKTKTYLVALVYTGVIISIIVIGHLAISSTTSFFSESPGQLQTSIGESRQVDLPTIQRLIRENWLSDREAEYYQEK